ncbi:MAG: hypothetical protein POELPBGB_01876 [Bacteroidia bacterium]|nr:hypothetical protein [Bacteroidia bacterium]
MIKLYSRFFTAKTLRRKGFLSSVPLSIGEGLGVRLFSLCLCASVVITSCNKPEDPDPTDTTPVFFINGQLDNDDMVISAGVNNYYMFSSYLLDTSDVFRFEGKFQLADCNSSCPQTLSISFANNVADNNPGSAITAASFPLTYLSYSVPGGALSAYSVEFTPLTTGGQPQSFLWDFGDGNISTENKPTHMYANSGIYTVSLNVTYASGCSSSITNPLNLGVSALSCDAGFILSSLDTTTVTLSSNPGGTGPWTYDWDFGDGSPHNNTANPTHTYATQGVYQVCLTTVSSDSCTNTRCLNVATENPGTCSIRYATDVTSLANPLNLSSVIVEWVNESGVKYTSYNAAQPASSYFKINSVEDYQNNENGEKTKKLNLSLSCTLYNGNNAIQLENAEATIAVAYP